MTGTSLASSRWLQLVLAMWLLLGAAVSVRTFVWPEKRTVFPVFSAGARHWWADESLYYPYSDNTGGYRYSPIFAIFMTPFALLGNTTGGVLWSWLNLGVYLLGLRWFVRDVLPGDWPAWREALLYALGLWGAMRCAWNSQANILVIGCLLMAASALVRERWWQAAFLLAAPVFLKLSPLAVALLFCALMPRKLLPRFALVLLLGAALPFLTRPPEIVLGHYREWHEHLSGSAEARWPGLRDGWTVFLLVRHALGEDLDLRITAVDSPLYRILQCGSGVLLAGWCLWQQRRGISRSQLILFTMAGGAAWLMLFGPATEFPTYVILAPFAAYALLDSWHTGRGFWTAGATWMLTAVLPWNAATGQFQDDVPLLFAVLPAGAACFLLWLLVHAQRTPAALPLLTSQPRTIIDHQSQAA